MTPLRLYPLCENCGATICPPAAGVSCEHVCGASRVAPEAPCGRSSLNFPGASASGLFGRDGASTQAIRPRDLDFATASEWFRYDKDRGGIFWKKKSGRHSSLTEPAGRFARGYRQVRFQSHFYYVHRIVWVLHKGKSAPGLIDHINCDPSDNRIENLRACSSHENAINKRRLSRNSSGFKGVSFHRGARKYTAQIGAGGKQFYLGLFDTAEAAYAAYRSAALRLHGEFARLD